MPKPTKGQQRQTKEYPGTLRLKGQSWHLVLWSRGKPHYFTLGPVSRQDAMDLAWEKHREVQKDAEREEAGLPGPGPVSELFDLYERTKLPHLAEGTQRAYRGTLKQLRAFFVERLGNPRVDKIRSPHVRRFLDWRRGHGVSARTLAKDRATLSTILTFARRELEVMEGNPVENVEAPKHDAREPVILTAEQYEALLRECAERPMLQLFVLTAGETGARSESEVLHLRFEDVDLEASFVQIRSGQAGHRTKSGKSRWVPMTSRLKEAMRDHFARYRFAAYGGKRSPWVFHHTLKRRHAEAGQRIGSLRRAFLSAAARAKLPEELHVHDLRHTRVTTWLAAGKNPVHVKEAVGHSDLRTTMGYTHLAREHLRSLVEGEEDGRAQLKRELV